MGFRHVSPPPRGFYYDLISRTRLTRPSCTATRRPVAGPCRTQASTAPNCSSRPRSPLDQWDTRRRSEQWIRVCERLDRHTTICTSIHLPLLRRFRLIPFRILIHAPYGGKEARLGSWKALVEAQKAGKTKSIGVSNYGIHHLEELEDYIKGGGGGEISVGQYELHPWLDHSDIAEWLHKRNIIVEAYSPLAHGERLREPVLKNIGKKYGKSPAQVLIRWSLQMVSTVYRMKEDPGSVLIELGIPASAQVRDAAADQGEHGGV